MEGRTALVTGSTSGIGLGVAKVLASRGCNIIVTGLGSQEVINQCVADIKSAGKGEISVNYLPAELRNPEEITRLCEEACKLHPKGVDILFNNAGTQHVASVIDLPLDQWNEVISVNLTAPFLFIKLLLPQMKKNGWGRIVNTGSALGLVGATDKGVYTASKHGIVGLTKVVGLETAGTGVTCNAICPGFVLTPLIKRQIEDLAKQTNTSFDEAKIRMIEPKMPSGEPVTVEEVAELVAYLCSPAARSITGTPFSIDGGYVAH